MHREPAASALTGGGRAVDGDDRGDRPAPSPSARPMRARDRSSVRQAGEAGGDGLVVDGDGQAGGEAQHQNAKAMRWSRRVATWPPPSGHGRRLDRQRVAVDRDDGAAGGQGLGDGGQPSLLDAQFAQAA
jgi:hypothetical protein